MVALFAAVPVLILRPFQNTPFIDDWVYAWSVEHLLHTGQLRVLDLSTSLNVAQTLWGALFCLPFGFSFTALRISTWTLSVFGLIGFYLLMRLVGISRRDALISAALLEACPVYFILSFTYMTDVPWLAMAIWSVYCLVRGVSLKNDRCLAAAAAFAFLAGAIRLTGLLLPLVMLAVLLFHSGHWGRQLRPLVFPLAALAGLIAVVSYRSEYTVHRADLTWLGISPAHRAANLKYGFLLLYRYAPEGLICTAAILGFFLVPWIVGSVRRVHLRPAILVFGGILVILAGYIIVGGRYHPILSPGSTWSLYELGDTESLINQYDQPVMANSWQWVFGLFAYPAFSITVASAIRCPSNPGTAAVQWYLTGGVLLICVLWLFYDRYLIMLLPFLPIILLQRSGFARPFASIAAGAVFLTLSILGMRDHLEYNRAVWNGVTYLRDHGVKDNEIHGGYPINGWLQYAHPKNAPKQHDNGDILVPWVNEKLMLAYQISNQPIENWRELKTIPYRRWIGRSGSIYLLKRSDAAP